MNEDNINKAAAIIAAHIVAKFGTITGAAEYVNAQEDPKKFVVIASQMDRTFWIVTARHAKILFAAGFVEILIARRCSKRARRARVSRIVSRLGI